MPLVDLSTKDVFEAYYNKGTNIWLLEHPDTGVRAVWIQGQGDQPFHTTHDKRWEVRVHYIRELELNAARHRASVLIPAINLTAADKICIVGAGFGWLQEALEEALPGIECVSVDTSPYVHGAKDQTETAELDTLIQAAGILPVEAGYTAAMNRLNDNGNKARRAIHNEDLTNGGARQRVKQLLSSGDFTWAISEHVFEWLTDAEAVLLDDGGRKLVPNICHMLREYDPDQATHTEPGTLSNWKWLTQASAISNGGVKQELLDQAWYTVDNWETLLPNATLVGV